jgi:rRNA maturation RNase YbeY
MAPRDQIRLTDRQRSRHLDPDRIRRFVARVLPAVFPDPVEVSIAFVGRRAIAALSRRYRGISGATDQLSFTLPAARPVEGHRVLGDLVLCPDVIATQCSSPPPDGRPRTGVPDRELALVLIHGLLHLAGHTHSGARGDAARMIREEIRLYGRFARYSRGMFRIDATQAPSSRRGF